MAYTAAWQLCAIGVKWLPDKVLITRAPTHVIIYENEKKLSARECKREQESDIVESSNEKNISSLPLTCSYILQQDMITKQLRCIKRIRVLFLNKKIRNVKCITTIYETDGFKRPKVKRWDAWVFLEI